MEWQQIDLKRFDMEGARTAEATELRCAGRSSAVLSKKIFPNSWQGHQLLLICDRKGKEHQVTCSGNSKLVRVGTKKKWKTFSFTNPVTQLHSAGNGWVRIDGPGKPRWLKLSPKRVTNKKPKNCHSEETPIRQVRDFRGSWTGDSIHVYAFQAAPSLLHVLVQDRREGSPLMTYEVPSSKFEIKIVGDTIMLRSAGKISLLHPRENKSLNVWWAHPMAEVIVHPQRLTVLNPDADQVHCFGIKGKSNPHIDSSWTSRAIAERSLEDASEEWTYEDASEEWSSGSEG